MSFQASANFCRRVGTGFKAGVDILRAIASESRHGTTRQRGIMSDVAQSLRDGNQLHAAMNDHPKFFPPLMIAMTRAGETTGTLDRTLLALADYYEERVKIYREFVRRIVGPMIQLFMAINILALLIYILGILGDRVVDFTGLGLRGGAGVLRLYGFVFAVGLVIAVLITAFRKNVAGVQNLIPLLYKIPVAGAALQTITLARFAWTLALSLEAGIDPIRALQMSLDATDSEYYRSGKKGVETSIRDGSSMSEAMLATGVFPDEFVTEVGVAEMSGTDAEAMHHLAAQYDTRSKAAMRTLAGLASGLIGALVTLGILALILKMLLGIYGPGGVYSEALEATKF